MKKLLIILSALVLAGSNSYSQTKYVGQFVGNGAGLTNVPSGGVTSLSNVTENAKAVNVATNLVVNGAITNTLNANGLSLSIQSPWVSNTTYAAPFNFFSSYGWHADFDHPCPDVQTSWGYNIGPGGSQNLNEPQFFNSFESRWQNYNGVEQSEFYSTYTTPTNGYGTNFSFRWFGFTPSYYVNAYNTNQTYVTSAVNFQTEYFWLQNPKTLVAPPWTLTTSIAGKADQIILGDLNIKRNPEDASSLRLYGSLLTYGNTNLSKSVTMGISEYSPGGNQNVLTIGSPVTATPIEFLNNQAVRFRGWSDTHVPVEVLPYSATIATNLMEFKTSAGALVANVRSNGLVDTTKGLNVTDGTVTLDSAGGTGVVITNVTFYGSPAIHFQQKADTTYRAGGLFSYVGGETLLMLDGGAFPGELGRISSDGTTMYFKNFTTPISLSSSNITSSGKVTATNGFLIPTNYTAANFAPSAGLGKLVISNAVLYFVTDTKTNLVSDGR